MKQDLQFFCEPFVPIYCNGGRGESCAKYQALAAKSKDYLLLPVGDKVCPLSGVEMEGSGGYLSARPNDSPLSTMAPSKKVYPNISSRSLKSLHLSMLIDSDLS